MLTTVGLLIVYSYYCLAVYTDLVFAPSFPKQRACCSLEPPGPTSATGRHPSNAGPQPTTRKPWTNPVGCLPGSDAILHPDRPRKPNTLIVCPMPRLHLHQTWYSYAWHISPLALALVNPGLALVGSPPSMMIGSIWRYGLVEEMDRAE